MTPQTALARLLTLATNPTTDRTKLVSAAMALDNAWRAVLGEAAQELADSGREASAVSWRLAREHAVTVDQSSKATRKLEKGAK